MNKRKTLISILIGIVLGLLSVSLTADVYFNSVYNRPCSWDYGLSD